MSVSFNEIGQVCVTFTQGANVQEGQVCKTAGNCKVAGCSEGDKFCGVAATVRGGYVGVIISGFVTVPYTGSAPTCGYNLLAADGNGGIMVDETNGRQILVVETDIVAKTMTLYL